MSNLALLPIEDNFQTTLSSPMTDSASDLILYCDAVPTATIPASFKVAVVVDAGTTKEEVMKVSSIDTVLNTMTVTSGDRAQNLGNGYAGSLQTHSIGATVTISDSYIYWDAAKTAINSKADLDSPSFTTYVRVPVYATTAARDAAITSPANGMLCYVTADGVIYQYIAGAWAQMATGTTANASTTVAGKVELATQAELNAGTATGGTGASLVATPDLIAVASQNQTHNYFADSGAANAIVITPTPAISAYAAGQRFAIKVAAANTGATTINVNGLGAKNLYKNTSSALVLGDLLVGQMIEGEYDGTQFQLMSPSSINPSGSLSITTAEAIDGSVTPVYAAYGSANMKDVISIRSGGTSFEAGTGTGRNVGDVDARTKLSQSFVYTDSLAASIAANNLTIFLKIAGAAADNFYCEIQTDSAGSPSGSVVTNGTSAVVSGASLSTAYRPQKITWATPPTLTSGSTYHLVLRRSGANDAANYFVVLDSGGNNYANGTAKTYTASTLTWADLSLDIQMQLVFDISYAGKLCKCDADNILRANGVGFVTSNVSSGANAEISPDPITYSGLTDGKTYVASTTAGSIVADTSSPTGVDILSPTPHVVAGQVINGKIKNSTYKKITLNGDALGLPTAVASTFFDLFVPTGFRADEVILRYSYNDASATANTLATSVEKEYIGLTEVGGTYFPDAVVATATSTQLAFGALATSAVSYGTVGISAPPYRNSITLQDIYDNGLLVRINLDATADTVGLQQIIAVKH